MLIGLRFLTALLMLGTACGPAGATSDWISLKIGSILTLEAPAGTTFKTVPGDSFVGALTGPGFALQLDYGLYSDPLTDQSRFSKYNAETAKIDGRAAMVVEGMPKNSKVPGRFIGLHVPNLGHSTLGTLSLTVAGTVPGQKEITVVRHIFATIHFVSKQ